MQEQIITNEDLEQEVLRLEDLTTEEMFKELLERVMILEKIFILLCQRLGLKSNKQKACKAKKCKSKKVKVKAKTKKVAKKKK